MQPNPKVVFIISAGHSGSTLLDLIAGTLPDVMSTGELIWLPWQTWRDGKKCNATPKQDICTCLKTFRDCPAWRRVLNTISEYQNEDILTDPLSYNISFLRNKKYDSAKSYKYLILRKIITAAIIHSQNWLVDKILNSQKEQVCNTLILYDSISKALKTNFIADSSKDILRAYAIWKKRPEDVKIILLYKDAKSLAASGKHWQSKVSTEKRLKKWFFQYQNHFVPILQKMTGCNMLIAKYDEICRQPGTFRNNMAKFIGLESTHDDFQINTREMHIVAGNPMRFKGKIDIKYDDRWRTELSSEELKLAEHYERKMQNLISTLQA